jgi:hypothetical protein
MFFSTRKRRSRIKQPTFRHVKLCLETLEGRLAPATLIVTGIGDTIAADGLVTHDSR